MGYQLSIITPTGKIFDGPVESTIAPGQEGIFEVLTGHVPMVVILEKGDVTLREQARKLQFSIGSGVLEVDQRHNVLLLADFAKPPG